MLKVNNKDADGFTNISHIKQFWKTDRQTQYGVIEIFKFVPFAFKWFNIFLYVPIMSLTRFRVNSHSIVA